MVTNNKKIKLRKVDYNYEASVIVMNKNRLPLLKKCLESIEKFTSDVNYELIIVDNLSSDGSQEYLLKEWKGKASLIFEKDPTSYAASNNRVMKWSYGKYIYLLNNDCEVTQGWLRNAIDFAEKNPEVGHVASLVLWPDGTVMSHGANLLASGYTAEIGKFYPNEKQITREVGNFAYAGFGLYRRDVAEKIGFLPEYNVPIYFDDTGYSCSVWSIGYTVTYCPDSKIIHALFHDHNRDHHKELKADSQGLKYFLEDWGDFLKENNGFFPDYPFTGRRPYKNGEKNKIIEPLQLTTSPKETYLLPSQNKETPDKQKKYTTVLIISNVVFTDGGGSKRPANLARAFLRKGYKVFFINLYPSYEQVKFDINTTEKSDWIKNLTCISIEDFNIKEFVENYGKVCEYCLVELPHEKALPIMKYIKESAPEIKIITEIIDNWNTRLGTAWYKPEVEKEIYGLSDRIHVTAKDLKEVVFDKLPEGKEIRYLPNAVNTNIFDKTKIYPRPADLPDGKDIVFYMGALWGEWLDFDVIEKAMKTYKDKHFVFCGEGLSGDKLKRWKKLKNCHLLGLKSVFEMPAYIANSSVCVIPFKFNDNTDIVKYVSPLKLFEYLAMQTPVIATRYEELENIPGMFLADTEKEFIDLIGEIDENTDINWNDVDKFISKNNWEYRISQIIDESPLISVVIPTYNHGEFLKRAIDSVLTQTYQHFELIIVNDGSTDNTVEILKEYEGNSKIKIIHQENLKLPAALNTGFKVASGEYYTWTSADNKMLPECLETLLNYLQSNPEKGMVYSNYQLIDNTGNPLYGGKCRLKDRDSKDTSCVKLPKYITRENFYLSKDNFIGASFLYHASVAKQIGEYDINLFGAEDYDFWLRLADKFDVGHCPDILYKYRVHKDTLNAKAQELNIFDNVTKCLQKNKMFRLQYTPISAQGRKAIPIVFQVEKMIVGGLEKVVYSLMHSIDRFQYEPILFIEDEVYGGYGERLLKEGFQVYLLKKQVNTLNELLLKIKPKIVNLHYSLFGIESYLSYKIKIVYTIHNNYIWFNQKIRDCRRKFYEQMDGFIAVSQNVKEYFIKYFGISRDKITVIPNGHIPRNEDTKKGEILPRKYSRDKIGFSPSDFVFVNVASITPAKQQNMIIEALKLIENPNIKVLFVGGANVAEYFKQLQGLINANMLRYRTAFLHDVSPEYVSQIYSFSNCFILPSLTEGWSMAVMEAIEAGLPLVLSNTGSAPELLKDNGVLYRWYKTQHLDINGDNLHGLLKPEERNIIRLKSAMVEAWQNNFTYKKNAQAFKPVFLREHTVKRMARQYELKFNEFTGGK